jgi:hypothetical protein
MPIPKPKKEEKQKEYVSRCIAFLIGEGKEQDQAIAIAYQMWNDAKGIKKYAIEKSIPWDISINDLTKAVSDAWNAEWPSDFNSGNYGYVQEIYLDGTCICQKQEKGQPLVYIRYDYTFDEDGKVVLSNPQEVDKQTEWVEKAWEEELEKASWTAKYINDLPDSSFAYIEPGGKKVDGKTEPRSLRHFPYKDADGSVDLPHLRNALARAPQSPFGDKAMAKLNAAAKAEKIGEFTKDEGDSINKLIELLKIDAEKGLIYGVVMPADIIDSQGDIISKDEIIKTAHNFMISYRNQISYMGEMHKRETNNVSIVESFVVDKDILSKLHDGDWVVVSKVKDPKTNKIWDKVKKGEYTGYSIEGRGVRTPIE